MTAEWDPNAPCEHCGHNGGYDHGMQFANALCSECVVCYPEEEDDA